MSLHRAEHQPRGHAHAGRERQRGDALADRAALRRPVREHVAHHGRPRPTGPRAAWRRQLGRLRSPVVQQLGEERERGRGHPVRGLEVDADREAQRADAVDHAPVEVQQEAAALGLLGLRQAQDERLLLRDRRVARVLDEPADEAHVALELGDPAERQAGSRGARRVVFANSRSVATIASEYSSCVSANVAPRCTFAAKRACSSARVGIRTTPRWGMTSAKSASASSGATPEPSPSCIVRGTPTNTTPSNPACFNVVRRSRSCGSSVNAVTCVQRPRMPVSPGASPCQQAKTSMRSVIGTGRSSSSAIIPGIRMWPMRPSRPAPRARVTTFSASSATRASPQSRAGGTSSRAMVLRGTAGYLRRIGAAYTRPARSKEQTP